MPDIATPQTSAPDWVQELFRLIDTGDPSSYLDRYYADDAEMAFASYPRVRSSVGVARHPSPQAVGGTNEGA